MFSSTFFHFFSPYHQQSTPQHHLRAAESSQGKLIHPPTSSKFLGTIKAALTSKASVDAMDFYDVIANIVISGMLLTLVVACVGHFGFRCNDPSRPGYADRERTRLSFEGYKPWVRKWPLQHFVANQVHDGSHFTVNQDGVVVPLEEVEDELTRQMKQQASLRNGDVEDGSVNNSASISEPPEIPKSPESPVSPEVKVEQLSAEAGVTESPTERPKGGGKRKPPPLKKGASNSKPSRDRDVPEKVGSAI